MKSSTAKSIKKGHSHQYFWPPNVNADSQITIQQMPPPTTVTAEELGEHKEQPSATAATT